MASLKRGLSSILLAGGLVAILVGLSTAFGFTPLGLLTSVSLVAALLYAGGLWLGGMSSSIAAPGAHLVVVFDRSLRVTTGPGSGTSVVRQFPEALRSEIEARCVLALRGEHTHFECQQDGRRTVFDVAPIQSFDGEVIYGVVMSGPGIAAHAPTTAAGVPDPGAIYCP